MWQSEIESWAVCLAAEGLAARASLTARLHRFEGPLAWDVCSVGFAANAGMTLNSLDTIQAPDRLRPHDGVGA